MPVVRELSFTVNGKEKKILVDPKQSLLKVLREDLNMTGTKEGCSQGQCGSCAVLVDGQIVKSCHFPVERVEGKNVITIEGLGTKDNLHPIQQAFIDAGAIQCGFCTPGMIITAKGLLDAKPNPTEAEIIKAFQGNLCRCTGYVKIIEAVERAAKSINGGQKSESLSSSNEVLGASLPRLDAVEKVMGEALYADDLKMEGILYAVVVRSPHHHALIKNIDKTMAEQVSGVAGIFTATDIPGLNRVKIFRPDQPILAETKVRFKGDAVALVVADSLEIARLAAEKVIVDYEELQPIFDVNEAAKEKNNLIHADSENVTFCQSLNKGEIEEGFATADVIIENTYTTPAHEHAYLEPEAGVAYIDPQGILVIKVGTQNAQHNRSELAGVLNIPLEKIRVVQTTTGGGFGGKLDITIQGLLATAAYLTRKPVKLVYSREESFLATTKRHPFHIKHRLGVTKEGLLTALDVEFLADTGAYLSFGPGVVIRAVVHATGPYRIPHIKVIGQAVYTNNPPSGAMRGFGVPQIAFAMESQMDIAAQMLSIDPLELRRINGYCANDYTATGQELESELAYLDTLTSLKEDYERAKEEKEKSGKNDIVKKGFGFASMWFGPGKTGLADQSEVYLELRPMGKVRLVTTAADIGQGFDTVMAQLVAKYLNLPYEMIEVNSKDTFDSPDGGFTCASRQTYNTGNAALKAAEKLKSNLLQCASEILNLPENELFLANGFIYAAQDQEVSVSMTDLYSRGVSRAYGQYMAGVTALDEKGQGIAYETYTFGTQMAEVEVNVETGEVKVNRIVVAHDVGIKINPKNVEGQLEGGVMMGIGMALKEEYLTDKTRNFGNYHIPRTNDVPEIKVIHIEVKHEHGPFGAAGAGECSLIPTAPAITNAISNALGLRFFDLPVTADKIKKALFASLIKN